MTDRGRDLGVDILDDRVRTRLAEVLASAGVPHAQIALEVLYYLPKDFLNAYEQMFTRAVKADGGEDARARAQGAAGEVEKARGGSTGGRGKRYKKTFVVLDEKALDLKSRMDKRLRMMGREIAAGLIGDPARAGHKGPHQCSTCGTFLQARWKFCPLDGAPAAIE